MKPENVTGIVLAGGKSSRMGRDKALLEFRGKPLIGYAVDSLSQMCSNIIISSGLVEHGWAGHTTIPDEMDVQAPMIGFYSCLKRSLTDWNILVSCDMPFLDYRLFEHLMEVTEGYDAVVPVNSENFPEPLCALYHKRIEGIVSRRIRDDRLGMQDLLGVIHTKFVPIDNSLHFYSKDLFVNINTVKDWETWKK